MQITYSLSLWAFDRMQFEYTRHRNSFSECLASCIRKVEVGRWVDWDGCFRRCEILFHQCFRREMNIDVISSAHEKIDRSHWSFFVRTEHFGPSIFAATARIIFSSAYMPTYRHSLMKIRYVVHELRGRLHEFLFRRNSTCITFSCGSLSGLSGFCQNIFLAVTQTHRNWFNFNINKMGFCLRFRYHESRVVWWNKMEAENSKYSSYEVAQQQSNEHRPYTHTHTHTHIHVPCDSTIQSK